MKIILKNPLVVRFDPHRVDYLTQQSLPAIIMFIAIQNQVYFHLLNRMITNQVCLIYNVYEKRL